MPFTKLILGIFKIEVDNLTILKTFFFTLNCNKKWKGFFYFIKK